MEKLKKLTSVELDTVLANTQAEIKRRKNIESAVAEIKSVLKKYKISMGDIDTKAFHQKGAKKVVSKNKSQTRKNDNRKNVVAKYSNLNGTAEWSGRGRAPAWVVELCEKEDIDLPTFKKDNRFINTPHK